MLLETLDIRKKDFMIFSQNMFDFTNNFRIINKSEKIKRPRKISYFDVCEIVKNPIPKNLIIYRLLTNVSDLDAFSTKYGYFIKIDGKPELIYFDPIFAIKDIRHLRFDFNPEEFRFKIQQLGLTSKSVQSSEADYEEVFGFDLKANEAQHQNDKIFADAIFAFDENYIEPDDENDIDDVIERKMKKEFAKDIERGEESLENISEGEKIKESKLSKAHFTDATSSSDIRDKKVELLKAALGIQELDSSSALDNDYQSIKEKNKTEDGSLFDLFKSTEKFSDLEKRKNQSFILKIKEKD